MITVMGATGNTGKKITERLLEDGEEVRALGRSEEKLAGFKHAGAEVLTGDAADAAFLTKAFRGADAVYTLLPPSVQSHDYRGEQNRQGEAITKAIRESGVRYVVALSSLGADVAEGTGLLVGLHAQEERLRQLKDANVLLLRPASFFENFYTMLDLIKHQGVIGNTLPPDVAIPMVATRDIADVAAQTLQARDWKGVVVRELLGPRDLTYSEATRIIGKHIGRPDLKYVQLSYDDMAKGLRQAGMSENFVGLFIEMTRAFREGKVKPRAGRTSENTTPTRFEDFAGEFAHAYAEAA
ncbi:MAG TPA: NAD(P)H-binding protein [Verrucomicrobiae bacterium]|nr:NAD(P)H-binding protein [Verrucomicrobiae bacterium]